MEKLNQALFLMLNAPDHPPILLLDMALGLADWSIWLIPLMLTFGWLRGGEKSRILFLVAATSGVVGLLFNQLIGLAWQHPRPFMIGLGHTFLAHAPDSSFPSDHLTLVWAVAFSLFFHKDYRTAGLCLTLVGLPVAWARIYLGVHFPLDMAGAALVAMASTRLVLYEEHVIAERLYQPLLTFYRLLAAPLIRRGWVLD